MKYMQEGGFQKNPLMRLTLGFSLGLLLVFWVTGWAMYFQRMDLTAELGGRLLQRQRGGVQEPAEPRPA